MGKTDLGKWMITNGGEYSADATYEQLTMVKYGNSTYITLKTVTGITPVDDKINYQLMAQGFDATALSAVQAEDTQGLCGEKGNIVTAQSLVDALADKVINTVMTKIGTAALTGGMTDLSSGLNALNSNLPSPTGLLIQHGHGYDYNSTDDFSISITFEKSYTQWVQVFCNIPATMSGTYFHVATAHSITFNGCKLSGKAINIDGSTISSISKNPAEGIRWVAIGV